MDRGIGHARGIQFDAAIFDLQMRHMDGVQLARALRELPVAADLPLVLLTSLQSRVPGADLALFTASLTKPARSSLLKERLLRALAPAEAVVQEIETHGGHRRTDGRAVDTAAPTLRALLAEDNAVNQKVAQLLLAKVGHVVDTVSNGLEATAAAHQVPCDMVLTDMQMPELDGVAATARIRRELPADRQPVIVGLTASVLTEDRDAGARAGMDAYLTKPIRAKDLYDTLRTIQARSRRHGQSSEALPGGVGPEPAHDDFHHQGSFEVARTELPSGADTDPKIRPS